MSRLMNTATDTAAAPLIAACPQCHAVVRVPSDRSAEHPKCPRCKSELLAGKPVVLDSASFATHVERTSVPVLVDFWAPWCGPCHAMAPALERAAGELEPDYRILKVNTEQEQALAAEYGIRSIPTLMMFAGGKPVAQIAGAMDTGGIVSWVRAHKPSR
jgi:thioredoxin 2